MNFYVSFTPRVEAQEVAGVCLSNAVQFFSPTYACAGSEETIEPYTTEKLSRVPGGYIPLTEPCQVMTVDFNDLQVILSFTSFISNPFADKESHVSCLLSRFNFRTAHKCKVGRAELNSSAGFDTCLVVW